jgi:iron(III) transport system permease protein
MLAYQSLSPYYGGFLSVPMGELSFDAYSFVLGLDGVREAIGNTLLVGALSATAVVVFTLVTSWLVIRSRITGTRVLDVLTFLPFSMPPVLLGLALIYVYLTVRVLPIYGSIAILVIAYVTLYLPFGSRVSNSALLQVNKELEEAGRVSGANILTVALRIITPLLLPAIVGSWVWVAAHAMRELTIALFLQSHRNAMVSTLIWTYWQTGVVPPTAAIGVMLIAIIAVLVGAWQYVEFRRQRNGSD